ncbi:MAG: hypothetical protein P4L53_09390 [Candidatus Obscuribacterales bacterium]|nr:hypothetical protein [Candidatus Obscuribacterales bacterium]
MASSFARRLLLPLMAVFAMLTLSPMAAYAAASVWVPDFNSGQTVYVDPALSNDSQYPVRLDGLESKLQDAGQKEGVHYFFIYEKSVPEAQIPPQYGKQYAEWQLDDVANRWAGKAGFSSKDSVVILLVRSAKNPNAFSYAADSGSQWQQAGLTKSYYTNVLAGIKKSYLPGDPSGFALAVAQDSSSHIGAVNAQVASAAAHKAFVSHLPLYIGIFLALALLAGYSIFMLVRFGKAKKLLADLLADLQPKFDSFNQVSMKIQNSYMGFLSDQRGWQGKLTGVTQKKFSAAVASYSDLTIQRQVALDLLAAGQKALESASMFKVGALTTAYDNLTSTPVVITGDEIEFKKITDAFGGLVSKKTFTPEQLFANLNSLFTTSNSLLSEIYDAFESANANKTAIADALKAASELQPEIEAVGLSFAPYLTAYNDLVARAGTTVAGISSDPVSAVSGSTSLRSDAEKLKASIQQAVSLKKDVLTVSTAIADARTEIAAKRAVAVDFTFVSSADPATFAFAEEGYNPDTVLAQADGSLKSFSDALGAGRVEEAQSAKAAALASVTAALALVASSLAAKKAVEEKVPVLSATFSDYAALSKVGVLYKAQSFVGAAAILSALESLTELENNGAMLSASAAKNPKLSDVTLSKVTTLSARIADVVSAYKGPSFDGARAQALHDTVAQEFEGAQDAIAADEKVFKSASDAVASFRAAYSQAVNVVNDSRVGQHRRDSLSTLNGTLTSLTAAVQFTVGASKDWSTVEADAVASKSQVDSLKAAAQGDIDAAVADAKALAELQDAERELAGYGSRRYVRTINNYSFGGNVFFDASRPTSQLSLAQQYYHARNYSAMRQAIAEMQEEAYQADTYAWWLTMELMSESNNVMAQRYAYELGYRQGGYDSWYGNHIGSGIDYNQPWEPTPDTNWEPSHESAHLDPDYVEPAQGHSRDDDDDTTGNAGGGTDRGFGGGGNDDDNNNVSDDRDDTPADTGNSGGGTDDSF